MIGCAGTVDVAQHDVVFATSQSGPPELGAFEFTDDEAWKIGDRSSLELHGASDYAPPHRSPLNIALIRGLEFPSFDLEAEMRQTGREYGHRDLCLFFGYRSPSEYYYVHLASQPDDRAHNVFIVNNAARTRLAAVGDAGVEWGDDWHTVRLVRDIDTGSIEVYFDGVLVIEANDTTFGWGAVGFGSFDDTGCFAEVRVRTDEPAGPATWIGF